MNVLDAVHQGGGTSWTIESLVADLPNGVIYLYYFYQFDRPVVLNVADELAHPRARAAERTLSGGGSAGGRARRSTGDCDRRRGGR